PSSMTSFAVLRAPGRAVSNCCVDRFIPQSDGGRNPFAATAVGNSRCGSDDCQCLCQFHEGYWMIKHAITLSMALAFGAGLGGGALAQYTTDPGKTAPPEQIGKPIPGTGEAAPNAGAPSAAGPSAQD